MLFDFFVLGQGPQGPQGLPGDPGGDIGNWSINEIPSGVINGTNVTFMLSHVPVGQVMLYYNGQYMTPDEDYTLSDITITLTFAPVVGDILLAVYPYDSSSSGIADFASQIICILLQLG